MNVQIVDNRLEWQHFFEQNGSPSFLESREWGEFQKKMGEDVLYLGIYDKNILQAIALVIKVKAKRGSFLFIPHGPIFIKHETSNIQHLKTIISQFLNFLISTSKKEGYIFIRIAPILENKTEYQDVFKELGFRKAPIYLHAERVWVLPIEKPEEEILANMRKTTRYLIRKAVRDGVMIEKRTDEQAVDDFWKIYEVTAQRESFSPFPKKFIREEFNTFNKTGNALFLLAKIPGLKNSNFNNLEIVSDFGFRNSGLSSYLASALIIFTKTAAFYHQGASIHSKIPATYLLQWEAIKEAKKRGCRLYNFWGILQEGRTPKDWQGLTLFKAGFGGQQIDYLPTQDFILSPKYYLTYIYEKFLSFKRGI